MGLFRTYGRLVSCILIICFLSFSNVSTLSANPLGLYLWLTTAASAVGGPIVFCGLLVASGVMAAPYVTAAASSLAALIGMTTVTATTPWYTNPWTIGFVTIGTIGTIAAIHHYWGKITPNDVKKSLEQGLKDGKITRQQYDDAMKAVNQASTK